MQTLKRGGFALTVVITVASDAVQQVNGQDVVFVQAAPERFTVRPVRTGATQASSNQAGRTPILEGLQAGEAVVGRRHAGRARLHQQPEDFQPRFMAERHHGD